MSPGIYLYLVALIGLVGAIGVVAGLLGLKPRRDPDWDRLTAPFADAREDLTPEEYDDDGYRGRHRQGAGDGYAPGSCAQRHRVKGAVTFEEITSAVYTPEELDRIRSTT